jgi:hypothetical protein
MNPEMLAQILQGGLGQQQGPLAVPPPVRMADNIISPPIHPEDLKLMSRRDLKNIANTARHPDNIHNALDELERRGPPPEQN